MGPGIEDDSNAHEKMFYFCREGPIHRCHVCGQCFKIVRLKDEYTEEQDYYSMMFATPNHFEIGEEDMHATLSVPSFFNDYPSHAFQTVPPTNVYIHVNADEGDRILVDPAYKLERLKEAHEKLYAMLMAYKEVDRQMSGFRVQHAIPFGKDLYETWYQVELQIRRFDRIWNKVEKFQARKFNDPENHERKEKRMLDRKRERTVDHYTYFFGGLTEEEQQYRDYFETDVEEFQEDDNIERLIDKEDIANEG
mmetsp:Transcript_8183/g.6099  ORF Transcript_8183/g.6099 Transcript_8183/m.6099 type:complete len:251 (+) Transcript_8183:355-1107(+)